MTKPKYSASEYRIMRDGSGWAITRPRKRKDRKTGKITIEHGPFLWPGSIENTLKRLVELLLADGLEEKALDVDDIRREILLNRGYALTDALKRIVAGSTP